MGKTKSVGQKPANTIAKQSLHEIKNGSVKKNKNPKFKNTSVSKSALIDNAKVQNKNASPQKNSQENMNLKNNQNLFKGKIKQSKKKGESPKGKQNSPNASQNKHVNKKNNLEPKKDLAEIDDSDSDIDEGVLPQEYSIESIDETFEDEEESDTDVPNIFGTSLAEDSDEDDDDFEDEEDEEDDDSYEEEEKNIEHKGVKMFKGIKSKAENKNLEVSEDEDDEEDECSDDDEDDMDETDEEIESSQINTSASGIEDDEDFDEENRSLMKDIMMSFEEGGEDDEDEDSEEDEDEDAILKSDALGIKALLETSITDDDDDEDFNEDDEDDEDDDISDEDDDDEENDSNTIKALKKTKNKASVNEKQIEKKELSAKEKEEVDKCTICIDNIPKETKEQKIKKVFGQYGPINNVRFRCIIPENPKMSKKVAAITGQIHPKATTVMAYVNYKSQESAKKALNMGGKLFEGNYVNVSIVADSGKQRDQKKAVFIGNLKFGIDNNIIWKHFGECGEIESVHLIRDPKTGQTRGFGYVNFKSTDAVALALKLDGVEIYDRPVRVSPCLNRENEKTSNKKGRKRQFSGKGDGNSPMKKFKNNLQKIKAHPAREANVKKQQKSQKGNEKVGGKNSASFQGQTADLKEKKKGSKFDKKKKVMAEKFKPKKAAKA